MRLVILACLVLAVILVVQKSSCIPNAMLHIHKVTLYCLDPENAVKILLRIFGNDARSIPVTDEKLKARGILWLRLKSGAEIHLAQPNVRRQIDLFRGIIEYEDEHPMEACPLKENHVGIMVRDLSGHIWRTVDAGAKHSLYRRDDGMYQFYIHIPGCINYLELSSWRYDKGANIAVNRFS